MADDYGVFPAAMYLANSKPDADDEICEISLTEDVSQFITKQIKNIKQSNPEIIKRKDTENLITKQLDILYQLDQTSNKQYSSHIVKMAIDYDCLNYPSTNIRGRKFIYFCKVIDAYFDFIVNYGLRNSTIFSRIF